MRWDAGWRASAGGPGTLLLGAGADRQLAVDGLHADTVEWAIGLGETPASIAATTDQQRQLLDRLVDVGAVVPSLPIAAVALVHHPDTARLARDLADRLTAHAVAIADDAPLAVVLRTGDEWPPAPPVHHLGVDLTLHHTVLIGPLVLPGASACLRCLQARTDHLWPRAPAPPAPRITRFLGAVADLVAIQVELAVAGCSPLVNATIAWDLERGESERQRVHKLTGCSACGAPPAVGRVHLPWAAGATS
jgi:bacteriocin biosynthesis cyclodehydratase domain-containing protein